ncbi:MAG: 50S ribosomal protein L33 [bacterium]|nr:50S ribosomal protein L33 [bacterium]
MSQDNMIKLESEGDENGVGKGHIIMSKKNKKTIKERLRLKKHNPLVGTHTWYKETK